MNRYRKLNALFALCASLAMAASSQQAPADPNIPPMPHPGARGQFQGQAQQAGPGQFQGQMHQRGAGQFQGQPQGGMPMQGGMPQQGGMPAGLPMEDDFFPPEMLMRVQQAIGLTGEQRTSVQKEMQESVAKFTEFQWQVSAATEKLAGLSKADAVDEEKTLTQLDELLKIENEMKRLQVRTMIRIRNVLTPAQRTQLREMKRHDSFRGPFGIQRPDMDPQQQRTTRDRGFRGGDPQGPQDQGGFRGRGEGYGQRSPSPQGAPRDTQGEPPQ